MKSLRTRLTGRDRDLVVLGLDRVLWSFVWTKEVSKWSNRQIVPDDLVLMDRELPRLAELGLRFGVDLTAERIDRVFLNRATEHVLARRLIRELQPKGPLKQMLADMAREDWISGPYGLSPRDEGDESGTDAAQFDERGVHSLYEERAEANATDIDRVAHRLGERRKAAAGKIPVLDVYGRGPNLWLGDDPVQQWHQTQENHQSAVGNMLQAMHGHIFSLMSSDEATDWESRRMAFQAIRRAVLRESVLLRLLPNKKERDEASWGELIVKAFFTPLPRQRESMADRISVFLEDLMAASGSLSDPSSARFALYDATRLRDQQFVALVYGDSDQRSRERVFSGFNTPLLPEVLICTSVGQEGIDLHRHCRHVVHFDLAW
ncbi:MAG: C-terminal helicase domain-containing protein, partial [bacterium]